MNGPHHDDVDERLCDWVDGRMTERERERFAAELRVNASLRQQLAEYEHTVAAIRAALQAPTTPVPMADRVIAALATQQNRSAQPIVAMPWRGRSWSHLGFCAASAAALLLLALWIDSWAGRTPEKLVSTSEAAQADAGLRQADKSAPANDADAAASVDRSGFGAGVAEELRKQDGAPKVVDPAPAAAPLAGAADPANAAPDTVALPKPGARAGDEPKPSSAGGGGGGANAAPEPDEITHKRDVARLVPETASAADGKSAESSERETLPNGRPPAAPVPPPETAGGLPGSEGQVGAPPPPGLEQPKEAESKAKAAAEPVRPADVAPSPPVGSPAGPATGGPAAGPSTAGPGVGPGRYGSRGSPPAGTRGGGGAASAPAADGPWPELTIVGARPPAAELHEPNRLLLGFVVGEGDPGKVAAERSTAEPRGENLDAATPKKPSAATPSALSPAELTKLMATFVRSAGATPANELRWPTAGGGLVVRRLAAERGDDTDTVWLAEGSSEELRVLLGQVGAVAKEVRWRVQTGEFAPERQQRVLAAEATPTPASPPTAVSGNLEGGAPAPAPAQPGGRAEPVRGVAAKDPESTPPTAAGASRRRVVLRFRLAP